MSSIEADQAKRIAELEALVEELKAQLAALKNPSSEPFKPVDYVAPADAKK